jgi:intein/homing endonuclease
MSSLAKVNFGVKASTKRALKTTSTIEPDKKYFVRPVERSQNALFFYNNKVKAKRSEWFFASLIVAAIAPEFPQVFVNQKLYRARQAYWKTFYEAWTKSSVTHSVSVKKNLEKKSFEVSVPILVAQAEGFPAGIGRAIPVVSGDADFGSGPNFKAATDKFEANRDVTKTYDLKSLQATPTIPQKEVDFLKKAGASLTIKTISGYQVAMLNLNFNQTESEFLCNSAWIEIRALDFYGVIRSWVDGNFGMRNRSALFSIPLARIAKQSDARQVNPRLSEDGLLLDEHGEIYALPRKLNAIASYEESASSAYSREDGSFSAVNEEGRLNSPPPSMPVYIDWSNLKFAYTSLSGELLIQNLDRAQAVTTAHIRRFLDKPIATDGIINFISFTIRLGDFFQITPSASSFNNSLLAELATYSQRENPSAQFTEVPLNTILECAGTLPYCTKFVEIATKVKAFIEQNPTNAYAKYSVSTITNLLGQLTVFVKYGPIYSDVVATDNSQRKVYTEQGVDPNFKLKPVPFIVENMGLMPHQNKVENILRGNPANAILPVDAGGGKCLHGDTFVHTSKGLLSLKEIYDTYAGEPSKIDKRFRALNSNLEVFNLQGKFESVYQVFKRRGNLWELKLDDGTSFKGLKEHKFWTDRGWSKIEDLKVGDWMCAPKEINLFGEDSKVDISSIPSPAELYKSSRRYGADSDRVKRAEQIYASLNGKLAVTADLGFILGAMIAEGSGANFLNTDKDFLNEFYKKYKKVFGFYPKVRKEPARAEGHLDQWSMQAGSLYESQVLKYVMNSGESAERRYSHELSVPRCVRTASKETQRAFLQGWFEGDAGIWGIESDTISYRLTGGSLSQKLIIGMVQMIRNFGIAVRGGASNPDGNKVYYSYQGGRGELVKKIGSGLTIPTSQIADFQEKIGFVSSRKKAHLAKVVRHQKLMAAKTTQAAVNISSQGRNNQIPSFLVKEVLSKIETYAKANLTYSTEYVNRYGNASADTRVCTLSYLNTSFAKLGNETLARPQYAVNSKGKGNQSSRRAGELIYALAKKHPMLKGLRKEPEFQTALSNLKSGLECHWSKVKSVKNLKTKDFVYDLSLPSHSYTANGYFSHNTALILVEILNEIQNNPQALCLVMCPSHLVAQYVKEFSYFVGNNVNVIPVTSFSIRRFGFAKLQSMIENSPRNTVVVTDYNVITLKKMTISYGVTPIQMFPVVEFLRQFSWTYTACDESHFLKNGSVRNTAASKLLVEIPKKRLASGTMVANTITDLVRQIALLDPSIFGTADDFVKKFALETRGTKVISWKPGAEMLVNRIIKENVVIAGAKRKEWAAILPTPEEEFHGTELTSAQFRCYQSILQQVQEEIVQKAQTDAKLAKLIKGEIDEDDPDIDIGALLKPYLARLERFLTAPGKDVLGSRVLGGEDLISPKVLKIIEICRAHIDAYLPGKILIFTNYQFSAEAIFENFPADLKAQCIYYTAGNKDADGAEFERNVNKKIMVGIEQSMNTGLNLQFCSRLIRVETVWSPGVLEQGNSRVGRPNVKNKEVRPYVYYDWIACNKTIDVTKISYLMAKTISTAKFYEAGNPRFDDLEVPPLMSMTLDTVFAMNDFHDTLVGYFEKYEAYKQAIDAEKEEFKRNNKEALFDKEGKVNMAPLLRGENPEGCVALSSVIYQPGLDLAGTKPLGLVRYDAYMNIEAESLEETEEEESTEGDDPEAEESDAESELDAKDTLKKAALEAEKAIAIGLKVHTDLGDGRITRVGARRVWIRGNDGSKFATPKLATFVYTKELKLKTDTRTALLQNSSQIPLEKVVPANVPKEKVKKQEVVEDTTVEMQLSFTIVNDFLGIRLENKDNEAAVRVAQSFGFKHPPAYYAARIPMPRHMREFFVGLKEKGFEVDKPNSYACFKAFEHFKANRQTGTDFYGVANQFEIKNFYRTEFKPNPSRTHVNPYPLIQDGELYLALPKNGQPGSIDAMRKVRVPGLKWFEYSSDSELVAFTPRKDQALALIKSLLKEGVRILEIEKLKSEFKKLRLARETQNKDDE